MKKAKVLFVFIVAQVLLVLTNYAYCVEISYFPFKVQSVDGSELKDKYYYEMTAVNPSNPMPEGSVNGVKKFTVNKNGESDIGFINFDTIGTYSYKVQQVVGDDNTIEYDKTVWYYTVQIYYDYGDLQSNIVITKEGSDEKYDNVEVKHEAKEPTKPEDPEKPDYPEPPIVGPFDPEDPEEPVVKPQEPEKKPIDTGDINVAIYTMGAFFGTFGIYKVSRKFIEEKN